MKCNWILYGAVIAMVLTACNQPGKFKTEVSTQKKPWTNLKFNNNPDNFQFAIVSDRNGGSRPGIFEDAVQKLNLLQPEFVLSVGDLISGYTTDTAEISKQWSAINSTISGLKMPFFYLPGNHDITNKVMEKEWEKRYGRRYYSFNYRNTLFLILDSNDDDDFNLTRNQTDFVLNTLKSNSSVRWTFVLMHHPIWTYNTNGRFEEIENALKGRKYTVIAGHEHHYHQAEKNGSNYYILSTTGAGSALRGNYLGEFDHLSWVTMAENGPVMANLRLDGILPHDISNEKTDALAKPLIRNAELKNILLCNKGFQFTNGTLYLSFQNPTKAKLNININFFHHHQLQIKNPSIQLVAEPESSRLVEVQLTAQKPMDYSAIDLLLFDWQLKYDHPDYKDFMLSGKYQLEVKPSATDFMEREADQFADQTTILFQHPFTSLDTRVSINGAAERPYSGPVEIAQTSTLSFSLRNKANECSLTESRTFEKTVLQEPVVQNNPQSGLEYNYYEGDWKEMPDFSKVAVLSKGVASSFQVTDLAKRRENYGLVYQGFVKVPDDNFYLFRIRANYACRLYIDNKLVVSDKIIRKGEHSGSAALKKGAHQVRIEFIARTGDARLRVYTKLPGAEDWNAVDFQMFSH